MLITVFDNVGAGDSLYLDCNKAAEKHEQIISVEGPYNIRPCGIGSPKSEVLVTICSDTTKSEALAIKATIERTASRTVCLPGDVLLPKPSGRNW